MSFNINQAYIAIEGLPGTGKNQLAKLLAKKLNAKLILDDYATNPYLSDFYKDPEKFDLPLQLYFLVTRYKQQVNAPQGDLFQQSIISNYIFNKDQIYSRFILDDDKYELYNLILSEMNRNILIPDLVIFLHSSNHNDMFNRVKSKKRVFEKYVTEEYIESLNQSYNYFFERYNESSLLILNIDNLNLNSSNNLHFEEIFNELENGFSGSKYMNFNE